MMMLPILTFVTLFGTRSGLFKNSTKKPSSMRFNGCAPPALIDFYVHPKSLRTVNLAWGHIKPENEYLSLFSPT